MGRSDMAEPIPSDELLRLQNLLSQMEEELEFVLKRYVEIVPDALREIDIREHWKEVQPAFEQARKTLGSATYESLRLNGLAGVPLQSKTRFFNRAIRVVHEARLPITSKKLRRLLAWLLGVIENFLKSFAPVLGPLGIPIEAVNEFKDQMKSGLEFPDEED
jgi:hypothetical protein